jgi:hypothetical protein
MLRRTIGILSITVLMSALLSSTAFAGPFIGRPIHAPYPYPGPDSGSSTTTNSASDTNTSNTTTNSSSTTGSATAKKPKPVAPTHNDSATSGGGSQTTTTTAQVKQRLSPPQLKTCQNRSALIGTIMNRANTRAKNQITLFVNIASHVESFYTSKGKTSTTYPQLVTAVNSAEAQATTDLATLKSDSTFSCGSNNPGGAVSVYRTDLLAVQEDASNLRSAVKNLITSVAQAEGYTLPKPANTGGQQ